jgi:hypothetical protein
LAPLKFSYPLYLANGEQLGKNKHTTTIRTLENGGYVISKSQNKNSNLVGTPI